MTFPESSGEEWKGDEIWGPRPWDECFTEDERKTIFRAFYWGNALYAECDCCTSMMGEFSERFAQKH
jgi:hypothetical protein